MSTRTQLRFVHPDRGTVAQIYNHSDGYPDSIIPELAELREVLEEQGWVRGPNYAAAQFMFLRKLGSMSWKAGELEDDEDPFDMENYDRAYFLGGHGVENPADNIHGDEEYIYEVTVPHSRDDTEWSVKVSRDFPEPEWETRSGETRGYAFEEGEDAWTEATWDYEGDLEGALDKYTEE